MRGTTLALVIIMTSLCGCYQGDADYLTAGAPKYTEGQGHKFCTELGEQLRRYTDARTPFVVGFGIIALLLVTFAAVWGATKDDPKIASITLPRILVGFFPVLAVISCSLALYLHQRSAAASQAAGLTDRKISDILGRDSTDIDAFRYCIVVRADWREKLSSSTGAFVTLVQKEVDAARRAALRDAQGDRLSDASERTAELLRDAENKIATAVKTASEYAGAPSSTRRKEIAELATVQAAAAAESLQASLAQGKAAQATVRAAVKAVREDENVHEALAKPRKQFEETLMFALSEAPTYSADELVKVSDQRKIDKVLMFAKQADLSKEKLAAAMGEVDVMSKVFSRPASKP